jgi:hypothetical protein
MKLTYTVEFDIALNEDVDAFASEPLALKLQSELERAASSSFVAALCGIDDRELASGEQKTVAAVKKWDSKVTQSH